MENTLPSFTDIQPTDIESSLKKILDANRASLKQLLSRNEGYTWDNLMAPIDDMNDKLSQFWAPISHLHSVMESEALRDAYKACLPHLTDYHTEFMQNEALYKAVQSIANGEEYPKLNAAKRKVIDNELRDFRLAGVHLGPEDKTRFKELQKELSQLTTQFAEHLLDATHAWTLHITEKESLLGLPEQVIKMAEENAAERQLPGWVFTLDYACYSSVMKYLAHREFRWMMYQAYSTRASDQGPTANRFDNTATMENIVKTRHELALLLGFKHYAEYSLKTKMAETPRRVLQFLNDLVDKSKKTAEVEIEELKALAKKDGISRLEAWDMPYYTEKLQQQKYAISQEDLRPYFPIDKVLPGLFAVVNKLYGLTVKERHGVNVWHPSVQYFEIFDKNNQYRGSLYTDLYARPHKREGAWMDECRVRRRLSDDRMQFPIAFLTCNFTRPIGDQPALLTHDDVQTLFHEFGHCLHHVVTQVETAGVSGINGVPWDAVEFPSQFFEFWTWDKASLHLFSGHFATGEPMPDDLYNKLIAAKNFQSGLQMLRQLEFSLFDFRLHLEYELGKGAQVQSILDSVRKEVSVVPIPSFNRFQHSFSHIFAGGYAAGYYSYKWAEVLSSDAFSLFEEKGIFDQETGISFLTNVLEKGGVKDPMECFIAFRGREPTIDALLRHSGL